MIEILFWAVILTVPVNRIAHWMKRQATHEKEIKIKKPGRPGAND